MIAAAVTTQVDQASVLGLTAVMSDPMNIAPTARVHTTVIPNVALRKAGVFQTSDAADSFPYSAANGRPTTIVPSMSANRAPLAKGTNHLLDQLCGAISAMTKSTAMMTSVPQSKDLGRRPDRYSQAIRT